MSLPKTINFLNPALTIIGLGFSLKTPQHNHKTSLGKAITEK